ncbi:hypothetical protein KCU71_g10, partial [Aureobasidium melanogenum]
MNEQRTTYTRENSTSKHADGNKHLQGPFPGGFGCTRPRMNMSHSFKNYLLAPDYLTQAAVESVSIEICVLAFEPRVLKSRAALADPEHDTTSKASRGKQCRSRTLHERDAEVSPLSTLSGSGTSWLDARHTRQEPHGDASIVPSVGWAVCVWLNLNQSDMRMFLV